MRMECTIDFIFVMVHFGFKMRHWWQGTTWVQNCSTGIDPWRMHDSMLPGCYGVLNNEIRSKLAKNRLIWLFLLGWTHGVRALPSHPPGYASVGACMLSHSSRALISKWPQDEWSLYCAYVFCNATGRDHSKEFSCLWCKKYLYHNLSLHQNTQKMHLQEIKSCSDWKCCWIGPGSSPSKVFYMVVKTLELQQDTTWLPSW